MKFWSLSAIFISKSTTDQEMTINEESFSKTGNGITNRIQENNGLNCIELASRLNILAASASEISANLDSEELRHRCTALATGASTAAQLLLRLPAEIALKDNDWFSVSTVFGSANPDGTGTNALYRLGLLAMELGLDAEALAILEAVGTLLHGRPGGTVFKIESLLALGKSTQAALLYKSEILATDEFVASSDAIFASLWSQRGDLLWSGLKVHAKQDQTK